MGAWAGLAAIGAGGLSERVVNMDVHRGKQSVSDIAGILCPELVGLVDRVGFPVSPVYIILKTNT